MEKDHICLYSSSFYVSYSLARGKYHTCFQLQFVIQINLNLAKRGRNQGIVQNMLMLVSFALLLIILESSGILGYYVYIFQN